MKEALYIYVAIGIYLGSAFMGWTAYIIFDAFMRESLNIKVDKKLLRPAALISGLTWPVSIPFHIIRAGMCINLYRKMKKGEVDTFPVDKVSKYTGISVGELEDMMFKKVLEESTEEELEMMYQKFSDEYFKESDK